MDDRERWNHRYLGGASPSGDPDALLVEVSAGLSAGRAIDLAGGAGRNAIWLARHGWKVVLSDISEEGLAIAAQRAREAGAVVEMRCEGIGETLAALRGEGRRFDLVSVFWFLMREQFSALQGLLAPGGVLVYKTFTSEHARFWDAELEDEGATPRFALAPGELGEAFPELKIVLYREADGVAELVARAR